MKTCWWILWVKIVFFFLILQSDSNDYLSTSSQTDSLLDDSSRIDPECGSLSSQTSFSKEETGLSGNTNSFNIFTRHCKRLQVSKAKILEKNSILRPASAFPNKFRLFMIHSSRPAETCFALPLNRQWLHTFVFTTLLWIKRAFSRQKCTVPNSVVIWVQCLP